MRKTHYFRVAVLLCLAIGISSCVSDKNELLPSHNQSDNNSLELNYQVDYPVDIHTYATIGKDPIQSPRECDINSILILFFDPNNSDRYLGYTSTGTATPDDLTKKNTGTIRTTLPSGDGGPISNDDALKLIVVANYENKMNFEGENTLKKFIETKIEGKNYDQVLKSLKLYNSRLTGMQYPLPMSSSVLKEAGEKKANIKFRRRVARIDVENTATNFELKSVRLYNANNNAFAFDEGGVYFNDANEYTNYSNNIVEVDSNKGKQVVEGKLYSFPNYNEQPTDIDHVTTCLIIGGMYNGELWYYRVNITFPNGAQKLKSNGLYRVKITNVKGEGEKDPEDAYDNSQLQLDYEINEWENGVDDGFSVDKDGNALGVSSSSVVFASKGGQKIPLEVFLVQSTTNPLNLNDWNVDPIITGTDADKFTIEKDASNPIPTVIVSTTSDNRTIEDYVATAFVTWGSIKAPISLKQLGVNSSFNGISIYPRETIFGKEGGVAPTSLTLNLQGNFKDIKREDIEISYIPKEAKNWITLGKSDAQDKQEQGLFYYKLSTKPIPTPAEGETIEPREAIIKFIVKNEKNIATAETKVKQSAIDINTDVTDRLNVKLAIFDSSEEKFKELEYDGTGYPTSIYNITNKLILPEQPYQSAYYKIYFNENINYDISLSDNAASNIEIYNDTGIGIANGTPIIIKAKKDKDAEWSGTLAFNFEDGKTTEFYVTQRGVYSIALTRVAYYDILHTNAGLKILDRGIGQGYPFNNPEYSGSLGTTSQLGEINGNKAIDEIYQNDATRFGLETNGIENEELPTYCPPGYRLPTFEETDKLSAQLTNLRNKEVGLKGTIAGETSELCMVRTNHNYYTGRSDKQQVFATWLATSNTDKSHTVNVSNLTIWVVASKDGNGPYNQCLVTPYNNLNPMGKNDADEINLLTKKYVVGSGYTNQFWKPKRILHLNYNDYTIYDQYPRWYYTNASNPNHEVDSPFGLFDIRCIYDEDFIPDALK